MPKFVDYQNDQTFELEINPKMYFRFMNKVEKDEMRQILRSNSHKSITQAELEESLDKLAANYISLTTKEIDTIKGIAKRFI